MMLQIDHRESHDVDIFLPDAQYLSYLDPKLQDFEFEIGPSDYTGDGTGFLKLAFKDIAEIDFIIGHAMTGDPTINRTIEGEQVDLETRSPGQARRPALGRNISNICTPIYPLVSCRAHRRACIDLRQSGARCGLLISVCIG